MSVFTSPKNNGYWNKTSKPWRKRMCRNWMACGERGRCSHAMPHYPNAVCDKIDIWHNEDGALCEEIEVIEEV